MGDHIKYLRRYRAYVNSVKRPKPRKELQEVIKYDISFGSLDDLELLLSRKPDVTVDNETMDYKSFRKEFLDRSNRIYLSSESRMFDQFESGLV